MIKIVKASYGLKTRDGIVKMTPESAPFTLDAKREAELVALGVAEFVSDLEKKAARPKREGCDEPVSGDGG